MRPRDLPRRAAPILFAVFNLIQGAALLAGRHDTNHSLAKVPGPLTAWAVGFMVLAAVIPLGMISPRIALFTSSLALFTWVLWSFLLTAAVHPPTVSPRAAATPWGLTMLHLLLAPYERRHGDRPCATE